MPRPRSHDIRNRILAAATAEFADHGLAGGRVERIAERAATQKAQLYTYFGAKHELFDAVFAESVRENLDREPLDAEHLADWAVAIHDYYLAEPRLLRLAAWARLERVPSGDLYARTGGLDTQYVDRIDAAQAAGTLADDIAAIDVFSMVIAMAGTWAQTSVTIAASDADAVAVRDRRRRALHTAVSRAFVR